LQKEKMLQFQIKSGAILIVAVILLAVITCCGQTRSDSGATSNADRPRAQKTIFRDSDGNLITNNEFVDMRMANANYPDATLVHTLDDGTIEFRLQKIPQEGETVRPFSVRTLNNQPINSDELKGKVVVLNFWFIGCPPCMAEIPKLNSLKERFKADDNVVFVALTADNEHLVRKFLAGQKFDYNIIADAKPTLDGFGFSGYPKNIVISRDGKIVYWRSLVYAWDKFESVIRTELDK
jgi:thiol-disulfide isomerase/thioredoxin